MEFRTLIFLNFLICFFSLAYSEAQPCTPDTLYQDSTYGIWPDTSSNFPPAVKNQPYNAVLNFKFPTDAGDISSTWAGFPVDSARLNDVVGTPTTAGGIDYACNLPGCTWNGGTQGCVVFSGTEDDEATYNLTLKVIGYTVLQSNKIAVPYDVTGYRIEVGPQGIKVLEDGIISMMRSVPNPFAESAVLHFSSRTAGKVVLNIYDVLGKAIHTKILDAEIGDNRAELPVHDSPSGLYTIVLSDGRFSHHYRAAKMP